MYEASLYTTRRLYLRTTYEVNFICANHNIFTNQTS